MQVKHEPRGQVLDILMVIKYPDNSIKTGRLSGAGVRSIIFDPDAIVRHFGANNAAAMSQWNTGEWRNNPTVLVDSIRNSAGNACGFYCKSSGCLISVTVDDLEPVKHDERKSRVESLQEKISELQSELAKLESA